MKLCLILLVLLWKNVESSLTQNECSKLPTSEHAFVSEEFKKAEYQEGDVIYFSCEPGYTTRLNTSYICTDMGWRAVTIGQCFEHTGPVALSCRQPPLLENGYSQQYSLQYESGQRVRYWCNDSYTMKGGPYRTCTNGQWTGDIQCISIFCDKPLINNGDVLENKQQFRQNELLRYVCNLGYKKADGRPPVCQLGVTDQWTPRPKCEPITCKLSYNPPGTTTYDPQDQLVFRPGETVRVSCGQNEWVKSTELQSAQIVCQDTGHWDFPPECQRIKCPPIQVADNVQVFGDIYEATFGNVLQFSCKSRSEVLYGEMELSCDENGNWNKSPPTCKEISCEKPLVINGNAEGDKQKFKDKEVLRYTCNLGYKKVDGRPPVCSKLGVTAQWTPRPECEPVTCRLSYNPPGTTTYDPQDPLVFRPGETVRVSCGEKEWVKSTELQSAQIVCQPTGHWDFPPECQPRGCDSPYYREAVITDSHLKETYDHGDRVPFQCSFNPDTSFTVTCHFGRWTGAQRCTEKPCTTQPNINHSELVDGRKERYSNGERVRLRCKGERDFITVTCHIGEWRPTSYCENLECTTQPVIENAEMVGIERQKYINGERVEFRCLGERNTFRVTCQSGQWHSPQQCEERSQCGSTAIPNGFSYLSNSKLYYSCSEGYKLHKAGWWDEATCVNGQWNKVDCIVSTDCGPIPAIPHMTETSDSKRFSEGDTIPINCESGHQNLHPALEKITCINGKWNSSGVDFKTICTPIDKKCSPPARVQNAVIMAPNQKKYLSNTALTYKCRDNYIMEGEDTIRCINGTWEKKSISCKAGQ